MKNLALKKQRDKKTRLKQAYSVDPKIIESSRKHGCTKFVPFNLTKSKISKERMKKTLSTAHQSKYGECTFKPKTCDGYMIENEKYREWISKYADRFDRYLYFSERTLERNKILTRSTSMPVSLGIENNIHVRWMEFHAQLRNLQKICKKEWIKPL